MRTHVIVLFMALLLASQAVATTYHIEPDGSGDFPTIQEAIDTGVDGDSILLADGVFYTMEHGFTSVGIVYWGKGITIASASGDPNTCFLDGDGFLPVNFSQGEDSTAVLDGVTVQNGNTGEFGGGVHIRNASPTVKNCIIQFNLCDTGAGIFIQESSSPIIENCIIRNNTCSYQGGGAGGGIFCTYNGYGRPTIRNCVIEENSSGLLGFSGGGGGIYFSSLGLISNCVIRNNQASGYGGGIQLHGSPPVESCLIYGNECASVGSAICSQTSEGNPFPIDNCTIVGNSSLDGPAIYMSRLLWEVPPGSLLVSHSIIAFNEGGPAFGFGEDQGPVSLDHCDVFGNEGGDWTGPLLGQLGQDGNIWADPLFCDLLGGDLHLATGSPCLPENTGDGELIGLYGWGCDSPSTGVQSSTIAGNLELLPNFPNPFNGRTTFRFILTAPKRVSVDIVDVSGRRVIRLMDEKLRPVGVTTLDWDGRDDEGRRVSTGIYLLQVRAGKHRLSRPVMFLK